MAGIRKHGDRWRAEVYVDGQRRSKVCRTKAEAREWAAATEHALRHPRRVAEAMTVAEVFARYASERSGAKRGARFERLRLAAFARDKLGKVTLGDLDQRHVADWRDRRMREVAPATVRREMEVMSAAFRCARLEWRLLASDPMEGVKRPAEAAPRDRLPTFPEMRRIALIAPPLDLRMGQAWWAFRFSCRTTMRQGEVCGLRWDDVRGAVAHLPRTKNGRARAVPLSLRALRLLDEIAPHTGHTGLVLGGLARGSCSALFRRLCARADVSGLRFHDARAFAATSLARRVDVLTLARITGHEDIRFLSRVYYRESAASVAGRLG